MTTAMTKAERETFLAELHVGVLSVTCPGRGPLTVPIWYHYSPGGAVRLVTGGSSRKAALLRQAGRATLCAQTENPPYKYVTVEGPVHIEHTDVSGEVRGLAVRYLGEQLADWYMQTSAAELPGSVLIILTPEHWATVDYAKMM